MRITVQMSCDRRKEEVEVDPKDTLKSLSDIMVKLFNVDLKQNSYKIWFAGKTFEMDGSITLEEAKIIEGSHVFLMKRFQGGGAINGHLVALDSFQEFYKRFSYLGFSSDEESKIEQISYICHPCHSLKSSTKVVQVYYYIDPNLSSLWEKTIREATKNINRHAPGLKLKEIEDFEEFSGDAFNNHGKKGPFYIKYNVENEEKDVVAKTKGNIFSNYDEPTNIFLSNLWPDMQKLGTAFHETLHALGFIHEHCRIDRDDAVIVKEDKNRNYKINQYSMTLTPFDPFSIMMYPEGEKLERNDCYKMWMLKESKKRLNRLSELDKVSLNIIFPPWEREHYSPELGPTGLYYCGRKVMERHNFPGENMTDGCCGPTNGPNCPACRVLKTDKMDGLNKQLKFQGYSGYVYCGNWMGKVEAGHDGYCGPNNGPPCEECYSELSDK